MIERIKVIAWRVLIFYLMFLILPADAFGIGWGDTKDPKSKGVCE